MVRPLYHLNTRRMVNCGGGDRQKRGRVGVRVRRCRRRSGRREERQRVARQRGSSFHSGGAQHRRLGGAAEPAASRAHSGRPLAACARQPSEALTCPDPRPTSHLCAPGVAGGVHDVGTGWHLAGEKGAQEGGGLKRESRGREGDRPQQERWQAATGAGQQAAASWTASSAGIFAVAGAAAQAAAAATRRRRWRKRGTGSVSGKRSRRRRRRHLAHPELVVLWGTRRELGVPSGVA